MANCRSGPKKILPEPEEWLERLSLKKDEMNSLRENP